MNERTNALNARTNERRNERTNGSLSLTLSLTNHLDPARAHVVATDPAPHRVTSSSRLGSCGRLFSNTTSRSVALGPTRTHAHTYPTRLTRRARAGRVRSCCGGSMSASVVIRTSCRQQISRRASTTGASSRPCVTRCSRGSSTRRGSRIRSRGYKHRSPVTYKHHSTRAHPATPCKDVPLMVCTGPGR